MKPMIGIIPDLNAQEKTPFYFLKENYSQAIADNGGIPLILPIIAKFKPLDYLKQIHGLLITGGASDIEPEYFGESSHPKSGIINPRRTSFELKIYIAACEKKIPVLGICRGMQLINVAHKGTLFQDIHSTFPQAQKHENSTHRLNIIPGTKLAGIIGNAPLVVGTSHHQAVNKPGNRFQVNCRTEDGMIEGIEDPAYPFFMGLQWHPERFYQQDKRVKRIFSAFIKAAAK